jgi:hypothetical protein
VQADRKLGLPVLLERPLVQLDVRREPLRSSTDDREESVAEPRPTISCARPFETASRVANSV